MLYSIPPSNPQLSTLFYINTNLLLLQNQIFLKQIKFTPKPKPTPKVEAENEEASEETEEVLEVEEVKKDIENINVDDRNSIKETLENLIIEELETTIKPIDLLNTKSGEVHQITNFNKINEFKKNKLDNKFISQILAKEFKGDGLFITITTPPREGLQEEIINIESIYIEVKKLIKKYKLKYIKTFELSTKNNLPHQHLLVESNNNFERDLEKLFNEINNKTQILKVKNEELKKVAHYITKITKFNQIKKELGFEKLLKSLGLKIFNSSISNKFSKKDRANLFNAYQLHLLYDNDIDFIDFCLEFVKNKKKNFNTHLKSDTPHFYIDETKIYHSTHLRVFSKYIRLNKKEKRDVKKTHKLIVEFSISILNPTSKKQNKTIINITIFIYKLYSNIYIDMNIKVFKPP